ncbi:MAG: hypothetical protein RJB66_2300 [Pseudomonadota bacterium]|jgi:23S rRNA (uracil1939-C5)-methyltransferase
MDLKKGDLVKVEIEKLIYGGAGLARLDGRVIFVDYSAPGDFLEVELVEVKKNFARGRIVQILQASPHRVEPRCKVFGRCGGCQWQHVGYPAQIQAKQNVLQEVVTRFLPKEDVELLGFLESPQLFEYRNRIQVRSQGAKIGYYAMGSHELVPIEACPIAEAPLNEVLAKLNQKPQEEGKYRLQIGLTGEVTTTFLEEAEEPLGFAQVNGQQNIALQEKIKSVYKKYGGEILVDLYGGYGNLSIPVAIQNPALRIECVEWNKVAIQEGHRIAQKNNLREVKFIQGDVADYLQRVRLSKQSLVVLDPPRIGCESKVIGELASVGINTLVYVSCDPMTWGRDAQLFLKLARQSGFNYRIATIQGLDMFPQTDHIEVFSVFERMD